MDCSCCPVSCCQQNYCGDNTCQINNNSLNISGQDEEEIIDIVIKNSARSMGLSPSEHCALKVVLYQNYVRNYEALKSVIEAQQLQRILHPIVGEHVERSVFEVEMALSSQQRIDAPSAIDNPRDFSHGAIYVHRLFPRTCSIAQIVTTFALDLSEGAPFEHLTSFLSVVLGYSPVQLRMFNSQNRLLPIEPNLSDEMSHVSSRQIQQMSFSSSTIDLPNPHLSALTTLSSLGITAGSSLYVIPLVPNDSSGRKLFHSLKNRLGLGTLEAVVHKRNLAKGSIQMPPSLVEELSRLGYSPMGHRDKDFSWQGHHRGKNRTIMNPLQGNEFVAIMEQKLVPSMARMDNFAAQAEMERSAAAQASMFPNQKINFRAFPAPHNTGAPIMMPSPNTGGI